MENGAYLLKIPQISQFSFTKTNHCIVSEHKCLIICSESTSNPREDRPECREDETTLQYTVVVEVYLCTCDIWFTSYYIDCVFSRHYMDIFLKPEFNLQMTCSKIFFSSCLLYNLQPEIARSRKDFQIATCKFMYTLEDSWLFKLTFCSQVLK